MATTTTRQREGKPYPQEKKLAVKKSLTSNKGSRKRLRGNKEVAVVKKSPPTTTMFIPTDIIVEIFSWAPAKSLLRFRWACKYWFDLITRDPDFNKLHLHRCSTSTIQHTCSVLIHNSCIGRGANRYYNSELVQFSLNYYYGNRSCLSRGRQVGIPHPFGSVTGFVRLSSCNGLLFCRLNDYTKYCIWNPCTQEYRLIPDPPLTKFTVWHVNGFGYDHTIDDYKALRVVYSPATAVQVYTLGTNSWRSIGISPNICSYSFIGEYANGCLYWIDRGGKKIICFDLGKEKYQEESIEQFFHVKFYHIYLQVLEGSLCVVQYIDDYCKYSVQIWVMKDKATSNESITRTSWTQLFTTPISLGTYNQSINTLTRFSGSGEILLLKDGKELVLYDPKSNTTMTLNGIYREKEYLFVKGVYIESLVSLNSGTYVKQNTQR